MATYLGRRFWIWSALLALLALGLDFVPLFDVLGYDFSFALGLAAAFAGADIGHGAAAAARRRQAPVTPVAPVVAGLAGALAALVLPLALSLLNALRVRNCDLGAGLVFFALLPVGSAVYGATAGALAGWWLPRGGRLVAWLLPLLSIAWSLERLYRHPAVFVFDPFGGYFPGPIYDEAMRPPERLMLFPPGEPGLAGRGPGHQRRPGPTAPLERPARRRRAAGAGPAGHQRRAVHPPPGTRLSRRPPAPAAGAAAADHAPLTS